MARNGTVGAKFGGYSFNSLFKVFVTARPLPEWRESTTQVEGADGERLDNVTLGPRDVTLTLIALDMDPVALQRAARSLMAALNRRTPTALTLSDELDGDGVQLVRYAVPSGQPDFEELMRSGRFTVTFRSHDPYLYGKRRSAVLTAGDPSYIGVGGNAPAYPEVHAVPGPGSYWEIGKMGNDSERVRYDAAFNGARTLSLRMAEGRASTSASGSGLRVGSRFFPISGMERLYISSGRATVSWTERWL